MLLPPDAALCWAASILPALGAQGLRLTQPRSLAGCPAAQPQRGSAGEGDVKLQSGADSVGETCESVRSIANVFKSLPFLAGEAPLIVKSSQQMKQNKEEFNARNLY